MRAEEVWTPQGWPGANRGVLILDPMTDGDGVHCLLSVALTAHPEKTWRDIDKVFVEIPHGHGTPFPQPTYAACHWTVRLYPEDAIEVMGYLSIDLTNWIHDWVRELKVRPVNP
jgi:hypothetical protein